MIIRPQRQNSSFWERLRPCVRFVRSSWVQLTRWKNKWIETVISKVFKISNLIMSVVSFRDWHLIQLCTFSCHVSSIHGGTSSEAVLIKASVLVSIVFDSPFSQAPSVFYLPWDAAGLAASLRRLNTTSQQTTRKGDKVRNLPQITGREGDEERNLSESSVERNAFNGL